MKRLLTLVLTVLSVGFVSLPAEGNPSRTPAAAVAGKEQIRFQIGRRHRHRNRFRRVHRTIITRIVWIGRHRYRETIEVTYLPNGRTYSRVIHRERIGY